MATKKLINDPKNAVDDSLEGLILSSQGLLLSKKDKTVFRSDFQAVISREQVALISGGGSGHEPSQAGFVGKGMLTAAVCGDVFTSPPSRSILAAIKRCASKAGVLLIVTNYTGDRLNFGKAAEQAKHDGINVKMVIVDDDAACINRNNRTGRRGLCGTVFLHKIAGALAEMGKSLGDIAQIVERVVKEMKTISISLSSCAIPGQLPTFHISPDEIEFGLGVHGEQGIKKIKMLSCSAVIQEMIDYVVENESLPLKGKDVAVIVNNLGTCTEMEMNIVTRDLLKCLKMKNINVVRCYIGKFMTSLEMAGVSITLMLVDDERLSLLDFETQVSSWPKNGNIH